MNDYMAGRKTILLVEDESIIAMGEAALLDKAGYTIILALTGEAAIAEAAVQPIDLILMDINLGRGIDGTQAAQEILKKHDIPIIFLSSHTEPDVVAKTERITSYGYVVKSPGSTVLLTSIKMAFKLHATNQALRHTNEILSMAQEASHAGAWDWDVSRDTLEWSPELRRLLGVGPETEASFSSWLQIVHPEDREKVATIFQQATQDRTDPISNYRIVHPSGDVRWIHSTAKINYAGGKPQRVVGLCMDITDTIQAEEALRKSEVKFRAVVENSRDGILFCDPTGLVLYRSPSYTNINGYLPEERIGRNAMENVYPEDYERVRALFRALLQAPGDSIEIEYRVRHKNGSWVWVEVSAQNLLNNPDIGALVITVRDISRRKQAEDALRRSEAKFRAVVETSYDGILFGDANAVVSYRSPSFTRINGYPDEERLGRSGFETIHPDDTAKVREYWSRVAQSPGAVLTTQYRFYHKDGSLRWLESTAVNQINNPDIGEIVVTSRDISERKQAEEALHASEARYQALFDQAGDGVFIFDTQAALLSVNESFAAMHGYSVEEMLKLGLDGLDVEGSAPARERIQRIMAGEKLTFQVEHRHKDGHIFPMEVTANMVITGDQQLIIATHRDISERKRMEVALRDSEVRHRLLFEHAGQAINYFDVEGNFLALNTAAAQSLGGEPAEFIGRSLSSLFDPRASAEYIRRLRAASEIEGSQKYEDQIQMQDGLHWYSSTHSSILGSDGQVSGVQVIVADITARKHSEIALLIKDRAIETSLNAIAIADMDGMLTYINPAFLSMWGYSDPCEVLGRPAVDFWQSPDRAAEIRQAMLTRGQWVGELNALRQDGALLPVLLSTNLVTDSTGTPLCAQASFVDLSAQKEAEHKARENENWYRSIVAALNEGVIVQDKDMQILASNQAAQTILELPSDQIFERIPNNPSWPLIHEDGTLFTEEEYPGMVTLRNGKAQQNVIAGLHTPQGKTIWLSINSQPIWTPGDDRPSAVVNSFTDITRRLQDEDALRTSQERLQGLFETMSERVMLTGLDGQMLNINPAGRKIMAPPPEVLASGSVEMGELIFLRRDGKPIPPDERATARALREKRTIKDVISGVKYKNSAITWLNINAAPLFNTDGQVSGIVTTFTDISEHLNSEDHLRQSQADLEEAQRVAHVGNWRFDITANRLTWSDEMFRVFDVDKSEFDGIYDSFISRVHPDDRKMVHQNSAVARETGTPFESEYRIVDREGKIKNIREIGYAVIDDTGKVAGMFGTAQDITPLKQAEAALYSALAEKDVLMHELQHRVKNSLATAAGLLGLEASNLPDERSRAIFANTRDRLSSMMAVYEQLYRSGNLDGINLREYINDLTARLSAAYISSGRQIRIQTRLDAVELDLRRTLPLGIILNELVTNALKHAFPGNRAGEILISLSLQGEQVTLCISDNGVGLPQGVNSPTGIGLRLVRLLAQQIESQLTIDGDAGCSVYVVFNWT